ncbi:MAG: hypothetical protein D6675_05345 [Gemmatimonadetes bacterium]|nr:MAG: hypothetical protein D6675_05345 [Gemmatimonadota bacterium]
MNPIHFYLQWAILSLSLFNTILHLWLGLTVLLNAHRRTWGVWLSGGGLLIGAFFFVSHSAVIGLDPTQLTRGLYFWWRIGLIPAIILPFAWYLVILWYAGFWEKGNTQLQQRHRLGVLVTSVMLVMGFIAFAMLINPLAQGSPFLKFQQLIKSAVYGLPLRFLAYLIYIVLCTSLSLDVLRKPGAPRQMMGDLARQRTRPWLVAASLILLLISVLVSWAILWLTRTLNPKVTPPDNLQLVLGLNLFDLVISSLVAVAIIFLGKAIISYEVFTGKILPRHGFFRHWRNAILLAAGYGVLIGWALASDLRAIYSVLLTTILMTIFYALVSWRSYTDREAFMEQLRPFVSSQKVYDQLLISPPASPPEVDIITPFYALCEEVLGTRLAFLVPLGSLAPLVGAPLVYPANQARAPVVSHEIVTQFQSSQTICLPVNPAHHNGAVWAVPLWSERGLIGVLLLGEKKSESLYTQEEIEIARASGERLIDTRASAELARRLMELQRQRLVESQVLDQQAQRVLHDEILPILHTAILQYSEHAQPELMELLTGAHRQIANLLRKMPASKPSQLQKIGLIPALRRMVSTEVPQAFDTVKWEIDPQLEKTLSTLPPLIAEVVFYAAREAIRNAAHHGRGDQPARPLSLRIRAQLTDQLEIEIQDTGVGVLNEHTTPHTGQGLALHSTMMAVIGGALFVESQPEQFTAVKLTVPATLCHLSEVYS